MDPDPPPAPSPPPPVDPDTRVCARCGRPATDKDFCVCGANLEAMRGMLPSRGDWEKANPEKAAVPPPEPPPSGTEPTPRTRPIKWEGKGLPVPLSERMRKQIIPSVIAIAIFAVFLIFGSHSSSHKTATHRASSPTAAAVQTSTTQTSHSSHTTAAPTVTTCAVAWNGGRSPTHRHILDLAVTRDRPPVAVIASYAGTEQRLARLGGGSLVLVIARACVVVADRSVFIQQPNGTWGLVRATSGSPFAVIAREPAWTQAHHNATVTVGPLHGGPADVGAVTPASRPLVVLR